MSAAAVRQIKDSDIPAMHGFNPGWVRVVFCDMSLSNQVTAQAWCDPETGEIRWFLDPDSLEAIRARSRFGTAHLFLVPEGS
jgi:uncharacterized membrane protein